MRADLLLNFDWLTPNSLEPRKWSSFLFKYFSRPQNIKKKFKVCNPPRKHSLKTNYTLKLVSL